MKHAHISDAEIRNLFDAALALGFASERKALLAGLHPGFVASLPVSPSPSSQLLTDLHELNRTGPLVDDTVPLAAWLGNALSLIGPRREGELFERLLARVSGGKKPQPAGGASDSTAPPGNPPSAPAWSRPGARCLLVYVPEDKRMAEALRKHLSPMEGEGAIALWEPFMMPAGAHVQREISARVREAEIVLVLVSADLLASREIDETILRPALARLGDGLKVFPIIARACDYWNSALRDLTPLPRGGDALAGARNVDRALAQVVSDLRYALGHKGPSASPAHTDDPYRGSTNPREYRGISPAMAIPGEPIEDIFRVGSGVPDVTYVEPSEHLDITRALRVMGKGLVVQGPSGVGKTTAVNRAFRALPRAVPSGANRPWLNARKQADRAEIDRIIGGRGVTGHLIVDEAHLLDDAQKRGISDLIKTSLDEDPPSAKVTLIGIPDARQSTFFGASNLTGRFDVVNVGMQPDDKVDALIRKGEEAANVRFKAREEFVIAARGSFMMAQQLCLAACKAADIHQVSPHLSEVSITAAQAITHVLRAIQAGFESLLIDFAASDPKRDDAPRGVCFALLWLLSRSSTGSVRLRDVAAQVTELEAAVRALGPDELKSREASVALRGILYFGTDVVSIEDPQLGFYLRHLDHIGGWADLASSAGLYEISFDEGRLRVGVTDAAVGARVHFLDAKSYPFWLKRPNRLYKIFVGAYPEPPRRAGIAADAGIDPGSWDNVGSADVVWRRVLEAGARQGRLRSLVERAVHDRSVRVHHEEIVRLCKDEDEEPEGEDEGGPVARE